MTNTLAAPTAFSREPQARFNTERVGCHAHLCGAAGRDKSAGAKLRSCPGTNGASGLRAEFHIQHGVGDRHVDQCAVRRAKEICAPAGLQFTIVWLARIYGVNWRPQLAPILPHLQILP
jgi:hypothetical protein